MDLGHARAIPTLLSVWTPGDFLVAEALLVLQAVNGLEHPEAPAWREAVEAVEARMQGRSRSFDDLMKGLSAVAPAPTSKKRKKLSRKERQKRSAARRRSRRRKKKKRK